MNEIIKLILSLSISGSILAIMIFAAKPFIKHKLSKTIQYYIWFVVLLRLIIPFSFEGSIMNNLFYGEQTSKVTTVENVVLPMEVPNEDKTISLEQPSNGEKVNKKTDESIDRNIRIINSDYNKYFKSIFNRFSLYIWIAVALIIFIMDLTRYNRFVTHLKYANKPVANEEKDILISLLNGKKNVRLVRNRFANTPMLIGILRPCIIIPDRDFSEKQLENILRHEISHLRRFDIVIKWITMIIISIHWFNPLMYFIKKEINKACELACDEVVIKNLSTREKQEYGDTLISVVADHRYPITILQATMCEEKKNLKERLIAIMDYKKKSKKILILSTILIGLFITASVYLGAGVRGSNEIQPDLDISSEVAELETRDGLTNEAEKTETLDELTYDLDEISKYKTSYLGDNSKVSAIVSLLPLPSKYCNQKYISMTTDRRPYGLTVYYEAKNINGPKISFDDNTECNLQKNALVLFSMIDNLEEVTFAFSGLPSNGELDARQYDNIITIQQQVLLGRFNNPVSIKDDKESLQKALKSIKKGYTLSPLS